MKAIFSLVSIWTLLLCNCHAASATEAANDFNIPPVAIFTLSTTSGDYPLTVSFNGSASYDPDGPFINHFWSFGDGTTGYGPTTTHTYTTAGTFTVSLLVTDLYGAAHSVSSTVTVSAPVGIYTIAINPIEDAFLQVGTRQNVSTLEIAATKDAYIMFDLSGVIGEVIDANLRLSYEGLSSATGTVTVWNGNHNLWSETNLSEANKPFPTDVAGERSGEFSFGYHEWDISGVSSGNTYTYILLSDDDNFAFGSTEFFSSDGRPELFLTVDNSSPRVTPPTVSINSPSNNAIIGPGTDILFDASASDDGTVTEVAFYRGNILLGTDNIAPYQYLLTGTSLGEIYNVKAIATDNDGFTTSSSVVHVEIGTNIAPLAIITSPADGTAYVTGDNVLLEASASDSDGFIYKVEFYDGGIKLGEDTTLPFEYSLANISVGPHTITVRAYDNAGASTVSDPILINVNNACGASAVAEFEFDGTGGSGLVATNNGGTNGYLQGGATKVASSTGGNVLLLSSVGDYVEVPHYSDIGFTENISLVAWVNIDQIIGDAGIIVKGETARAYGLRLSPTGALNFNVPGGGSWFSSTILNPSQWYHVAVTYDGSNVRFYIDGNLDPNQPAAIINFTSNNEPLTIGADLVNTQKYFDGLIDETKVFCRALDLGEIVTLASATPPNLLPNMNITMPSNGAVYYSGDDILIQANADDLDGTVAKVEFFVNGVKIGEDTDAPYEYTHTNPPVGSYNIVVRTFDNVGSVTAEGGITVTVETPGIELEAECSQIGGNLISHNHPNASNGTFVTYPGVNKTFVAPPTNSLDIIRFSFVPAVVGTYEIHARLQASNTFNDSYWVRINSGTWKLFDNIPKSLGFRWVKVHDSNDSDNVVGFYLNAGLNIIEFGTREDGVKLDKISLQPAGTALPTGFGGSSDNCPDDTSTIDGGSDEGDNIAARSVETTTTTNELNIYPNPFHDALQVQFGTDMQVERVQLLDMKGQLIEERLIGLADAQVQFNPQRLGAGMYLLRVITATTSISKKVMYVGERR